MPWYISKAKAFNGTHYCLWFCSIIHYWYYLFVKSWQLWTLVRHSLLTGVDSLIVQRKQPIRHSQVLLQYWYRTPEDKIPVTTLSLSLSLSLSLCTCWLEICENLINGLYTKGETLVDPPPPRRLVWPTHPLINWQCCKEAVDCLNIWPLKWPGRYFKLSILELKNFKLWL